MVAAERDRKVKHKRDRKAERDRALARRLKLIDELRERWKTNPPAPDEPLDETAACLYLGGSRPIDPSTLRRHFSPGEKVGLKCPRWTPRKLDADKARLNNAKAA
jgi:hypothetical protein